MSGFAVRPRTIDMTRAAIEMRVIGKTLAEIAQVTGVSRQRVQQLLRPTLTARQAIIGRAEYRCEDCRQAVQGKSGHIHHKRDRGLTAQEYNAKTNLAYLCHPCHRRAHGINRHWPERAESLRAARDYLLGRQKAEGITAQEMARRLGMDKANWCHVRAGRRRLAAARVLRACDLYPELRDLLFSERAS